MNQAIISYLEQVTNFLGAQLDKLKIRNPLIYTVLSLLIWGLNMAFLFDKLNVVGYDEYIIAFLSGLSTLVNPRTSHARKVYESKEIKQDDSNTIVHGTGTDVDLPSSVESDSDVDTL